MTANYDSQDLIYTLSCECESLFDQLQDPSRKSQPNVTIADLCADYQQRFAIWAAQLGVFARRSQRLDIRLKYLADLQDQVARLIDVLRRGLQQCVGESRSQAERSLEPTDRYQLRSRPSQEALAALRAIDDGLTRLDRLGVLIRQSTYGKNYASASISATDLEPNRLEQLCVSAVQAMYPGAHQALKERLSRSMADRHEKMLFLSLQQRKPREPQASPSPGQKASDDETQILAPISAWAEDFKTPAPMNPVGLSSTSPSQKSLSETMRVQDQQCNYPQPPVANEENSSFSCEWCFETLNSRTLSRAAWRRHMDRDLEPYVCLFEVCGEDLRRKEQPQSAALGSLLLEDDESTLFSSPPSSPPNLHLVSGRMPHPIHGDSSMLPLVAEAESQRRNPASPESAYIKVEDGTGAANAGKRPVAGANDEEPTRLGHRRRLIAEPPLSVGLQQHVKGMVAPRADREQGPEHDKEWDRPGSKVYPVFPTFDMWFDHMSLHNRNWQQEAFLTSSWVCIICESNDEVYHDPKTLHSHLEEVHDSDFTKSQLQVIFRQSLKEQPRARSDCFLCCTAVDEHDDEAGAMLRTRHQPKQEKTTIASKEMDVTDPDSRITGLDCPAMSADADKVSSYPNRPEQHQAKDSSRAVARHVAMHLQGLMLLTLRFAALQTLDEDSDNDIKSISVELDEDRVLEQGGVEDVFDMTSEADVVMSDGVASSKHAKGRDVDFMADSVPVPDTDFDLTGIPRQYDDYAAENDSFLKNLIGSGAFRGCGVHQDVSSSPCYRSNSSSSGNNNGNNHEPVHEKAFHSFSSDSAVFGDDLLDGLSPSEGLSTMPDQGQGSAAMNVSHGKVPSGQWMNTPPGSIPFSLNSGISHPMQQAMVPINEVMLEGGTSLPTILGVNSSLSSSNKMDRKRRRGSQVDDDSEDDDDEGRVNPDMINNTSANFEGFRKHITTLNPGMDRTHTYLVDRIAQQQVTRYKLLLRAKVKHLGLGTACPCGSLCVALGGSANILAKDMNGGALAEGIIAHESFPRDIPMPPAQRLPAEFECQLCYQRKRFQKPSDWTRHIHEDVQPYTCTWDKCRDPKTFKRKADWVRHENEGHRHLESWMCNIDSCQHISYRRDSFLQHLVRQHKFLEPKARTKASIKQLGGMDPTWYKVEQCHSKTLTQPQEEPCRFCGKVLPTWEKLTEHLAKHMEQISLPVLRLVEAMELDDNTITSLVENLQPQSTTSPCIQTTPAMAFRPPTGSLSLTAQQDQYQAERFEYISDATRGPFAFPVMASGHNPEQAASYRQQYRDDGENPQSASLSGGVDQYHRGDHGM